MDIKLVRLTSGEELIGEVTVNRDMSVTIKKGIILIPAGEGKLGFMPFMPYTEAADGVEIEKQFIMFMVTPVQGLIDNHAESTKDESKIITPSSAIIL